MKYILSPQELKELTKSPEPWYIYFIAPGFYLLGILIVTIITGSLLIGTVWPLWLAFKIIQHVIVNL